MSKANIETDFKNYEYSNNSKEGEWEYSPQENIAICSECKYEHYLGTYHQYATNYCPNCGTKMKPVK